MSASEDKKDAPEQPHLVPAGEPEKNEREIVSDFDESRLTQSRSKTGKYTALTLNIRAVSRAQLDSIYLMLTSHPMVKVVL